MAQRGRKSAASVAVAAEVGPLVATNRLAPSMHLSDAEQVVWARLVNDHAAAAFTETHRDMLDLYCQHVVTAQVLDDEIKSFDREWLRDDDGLKRYDRLLAMREREVRSASSLATRLRITRQATVDPKTVGRSNANVGRARKPWEVIDAKPK
ncbi:hypothetical protein C8E08_3977 [Paracidovorax citrulli]|uniref:Uncharacterized protein n=1 Tax=Paracidovorax citrulli (strain AAC00-1) TaxID=397945 RepID=A1TN16_PARC0|nr:conserved hypothetical protein [Paracidovorax citrulli AAC00-1]ATG94627.1 hypothetical protein CQB05_11825 [Paracidovorax citrulli]MVT28514.1 hypothetical protein [Paracidovorax citrulli]PVY66567.1 hypothetical protein C8E08_3977 [Paracidovorax citrulli]UMT83975.1 hypothetical protein FRC75_11695 [Paracidovorax citrulli]